MYVDCLLFELPGVRKVRNLYLKWKHSLGWISVCHKNSIIAQMKMKMKMEIRVKKKKKKKKKKKMMMMMMMMMMMTTTTTTGSRLKCTAQPLSRNDQD
jgi:hypothetical protein